MEQDEIIYDAFGESKPEKIPSFMNPQPWEREGISVEEWKKKYSDYAGKIAKQIAKNYDETIFRNIVKSYDGFWHCPKVNAYYFSVRGKTLTYYSKCNKRIVSESTFGDHEKYLIDMGEWIPYNILEYKFIPESYSEQKSYTLNPKRSFMKKLVIGIFIGLVISGIGFGGYDYYSYSTQQANLTLQQAKDQEQKMIDSLPPAYRQAMDVAGDDEKIFAEIIHSNPNIFGQLNIQQYKYLRDKYYINDSSAWSENQEFTDNVLPLLHDFSVAANK